MLPEYEIVDNDNKYLSVNASNKYTPESIIALREIDGKPALIDKETDELITVFTGKHGAKIEKTGPQEITVRVDESELDLISADDFEPDVGVDISQTPEGKVKIGLDKEFISTIVSSKDIIGRNGIIASKNENDATILELDDNYIIDEGDF